MPFLILPAVEGFVKFVAGEEKGAVLVFPPVPAVFQLLSPQVRIFGV
jgi:hypothetical protein